MSIQEMTTEIPPKKQKRHRWIRRVFAVGGVVSVAIVCCIGFYSKPLDRYAVIGPPNPQTGIRIEFTVSSRYIREIDKGAPSILPKDTGRDWHYTPSPSSPAMNWLRAAIIRKPYNEIPG